MKLTRSGGVFVRSKFALAVLVAPICLLPISSRADEQKPQKQAVEKAQSKPSYFERDKQGVLWFQQGDDGQSAFSASQKLSAVKNTIVITVTAKEKDLNGAVKFARQMQIAMLKEPNAPKSIPIIVLRFNVVAWEDNLAGTAFTFYTHGLRYDVNSDDRKGAFKSSTAKTSYPNVVKHFGIQSRKILASGKKVNRKQDRTLPKIVKKNPSRFERDQQNVLWFRQGTDQKTKYSASLKLSAVNDTIVITVTANTKHIKDAVGLAKKMQAEMLKLPDAPKEIPIVAWEDSLPGASYTFYTDGLRYGLDSEGDKGVYQPSGAKKVFRDVVQYYHILRSKYVPSGKWGKHQEGWTAPKIIDASASNNSAQKGGKDVE